MSGPAYRRNLTEIRDAALDPQRPIADTLRMTLVLGSESGSEILKRWARQELEGYGPDDECPDYRSLACLLMLDGFTRTHQIKGQTVTPELLPEDSRDLLDQDVKFKQPIAQLVELADKHGGIEDPRIKMAPTFVAPLVTVTNAYLHHAHQKAGTASQAPHIETFYWIVSSSALRGMVDTVRTRLLLLATELLESHPTDDDDLSGSAVDRATSVLVFGNVGNFVTGNVNDSILANSNSGSVDLKASRTVEPQRPSWWIRAGKVLGALVATAAGVAAIVEFIYWLKH